MKNYNKKGIVSSKFPVELLKGELTPFDTDKGSVDSIRFDYESPDTKDEKICLGVRNTFLETISEMASKVVKRLRDKIRSLF